jgi:pimeloyl-ACP methyl ester carboxylesterase
MNWTSVNERRVRGQEVMLELVEREASRRERVAAMDVNLHNNKGTPGRLGEQKMPVLVAIGDNDVLILSRRSWELYLYIENALMVMYPRAGHEVLWQYAQIFARHLYEFWGAEEYNREPVAKL